MVFKNAKIEMAHKEMVQSIFEISKIEGVPFTFPETKSIVELEYNAKIDKYNSVDFDTIIRLKRAYQMCLRIANDENNFVLFSDMLAINQVLGQYAFINYGILRNTQPTVKYGEFIYNPPEESDEKRLEWKKYLTKIKINIDEILEQFFYIIKEQCFNDANKRTAIIVTNILLLKKNIGFLELDLNKINLFSETIFKFDHDKISLQEAIKIIKENFIVTDTSDRRKKPIFVDNSSKISEIEEAFRTYNISKNELSKMIGCDASNLNKIIKFKIKPSVDIAKRIGDVLKIEWTIFFNN